MKQRKIILLGKTGDGKSSAGNTILRKEVFITKASANSTTSKCVREDGMVDKRHITVIDTPGFFDTDRDDEDIKSEIAKALIECAPKIDAFVMVLKVGRYTRHENEVLQQFLNTLKEDALKHTVILFTFGEQLEGQSIEEFVKVSPKLQELVDKCGGRCHVIDNKYWDKCPSGDKSNRVQVKSLLETIDKMVEENGRYSNKLLQTVEGKTQEVMKINGNREEAKKIVHKKIMEQVVGAATGALIGALMGVGVLLASVVAVLNTFYPLKELLKDKVDKVVGAGGAAAVAAVAGAAAAGGAAAGGAAAGGAAAGGAAAGGAAAGAAAAAEAVAGGAETGAAAAAEAVAGGAAAAAGAAAGGAAVAGGAGGAGVCAGAIAAGVLGVAAVAGAAGGGITGWKAAEDADSVCDAMKKAAMANYENAKETAEKIEELVALGKKNISSFEK